MDWLSPSSPASSTAEAGLSSTQASRAARSPSTPSRRRPSRGLSLIHISLVKGAAVGADADRLLMEGGRWSAAQVKEAFQRDSLREFTDPFRRAVVQARETLTGGNDPQLADFVLDLSLIHILIAVARIVLIVFGFVLACLGFKRTLEPLIMVPMGIGMMAVNCGMMFLTSGTVGNLLLDPLVSDASAIVDAMQVNFLQPIYNLTFSNGLIAVSYTHLDVYKRQMLHDIQEGHRCLFCFGTCSMISQSNRVARQAAPRL